ncbi:MAG: hypothetical protein R3B09_16440 [Nannocystaceae bacterium]
MRPLAAAARGRLDAADRLVDGLGARYTLDPTRERARGLGEILDLVVGTGEPDAAVDALADGLAAIARAQAEAFPGNLFWDFEAIAAAIWGADEPRDPARVAATCEEIAALQHLYGGEPIRFRYVHDFVYGFDWAKWVRRDPPARRAVGPFDPAFLAAMARRGRELVALISSDDRKYHRLRDARPRNPFPFSREPAAELALHRDLAARGLIPVEAWRIDPEPRWDVGYASLRAERARALGLGASPR